MQVYIVGFVSGKVAAAVFSWEIEFKRAAKCLFFCNRDMKNAAGGFRGFKGESW